MGSIHNVCVFTSEKHGKQFRNENRFKNGFSDLNPIFGRGRKKVSYQPNSTPIKTIQKGKMIFFLRNRSR